MVDENGKYKIDNRTLVIILVLTVLAVMALVLGLVLTREQREGGGEVSGETETEQVETEPEPEITLGDDEAINAKIEEVQAEIDAAILANDTEALVGYYEERMFFILDNSDSDRYAEQVIEDAEAIDEIEQSLSSAAQVINTAQMYGREDVVNEYNQIMEERAAAEGVNLHGEGLG